MNAVAAEGIDYLTGLGFAVETAGGVYTVALDGELVLRQGNLRDFYAFTNGVALGETLANQRAKKQITSLDRALANSPAHQAAMKGGAR